ncbi:hypothetical protein LguiB_020447 [Lonicera macranthoides]
MIILHHETKQTPSRSYISLSLSRAPLIYSSIFCRGPLVALAGHRSPTAATLRGFGTKSSLNNSLSPSNGWSNSPQLDDGCDFKHWLIMTRWNRPEASTSKYLLRWSAGLYSRTSSSLVFSPLSQMFVS